MVYVIILVVLESLSILESNYTRKLMFDHKFNVFLGIFFLLFASVTYLSLSNTRLGIFTRASNKELDITKSVVLINKLEVPASGTDTTTVTVFARNSSGVGIENKRVNISSTLGTFDKPSELTDNYGKAVFTLVASTPGSAMLSVQIDNQPITSTYSILFK